MNMIRRIPTVRAAVRSSTLLSALACVALVYAAPARANDHDNENEFDLPVKDAMTNTYGPNGFEIDFQGNVCAEIPAQYVQDPGVDPFYANELYEQENSLPFTPAAYNCTFDGTISHATWSGDALPVPLPAPGPTGWPVNLHTENGQFFMHSGLDEGYATLNDLLPIYKKWLWTQTNPPQSLIVPVTAALAARVGAQKVDQYAAIFLRTGGNSPTGTWYLTTYAKSASNKKGARFTLSNNGPEPIILASGGVITGIAPPSEIQCQKTPNCYQLLLDSLNDDGIGEPGMGNSPWTPIKLPSQLNPGQTYSFTAP